MTTTTTTPEPTMSQCRYLSNPMNPNTRCRHQAEEGRRLCVGHDTEMKRIHEARGLVWDGSVDADLSIDGPAARNRS